MQQVIILTRENGSVTFMTFLQKNETRPLYMPKGQDT